MVNSEGRFCLRIVVYFTQSEARRAQIGPLPPQFEKILVAPYTPRQKQTGELVPSDHFVLTTTLSKYTSLGRGGVSPSSVLPFPRLEEVPPAG